MILDYTVNINNLTEQFLLTIMQSFLWCVLFIFVNKYWFQFVLHHILLFIFQGSIKVNEYVYSEEH